MQVHKIGYTTPINKILKLHINHSLNAQKSKSASESGTVHKAQLVSTKNVYNLKALNIGLMGICPSLHDCAQFSKGLGKNSDHKESLESNSLSQASSRQVPNYKENHQSNPRDLVQPVDSHLNPPPANIKIIKCGKCQVQLNKCKCNERCNACFNMVCTCSKQCNACKKYISKYSNFEINNDNFCNCTVESHMAIRGELLTQIGDEVSLNQQSDIENDLEQRLSEFDVNLENPNFSLAGEEIKIAHIKESSVKIKLTNIL